MQTFLVQADATPGLGPALREHLGADEVRGIEAAPGVSWLPIGVNLRVTHAVMGLLGDDATRAYFRGLMLLDFEKPFLAPVVSLATGLFGMDVGGFVKLIPRGFGQVFADVAELTPGAGGAGQARLDFTGVAPELLGDAGRWARSVAYSFDALFVVAKREGTVEVDAFDSAARRIGYAFRWRA
jgi:hypothetical protein